MNEKNYKLLKELTNSTLKERAGSIHKPVDVAILACLFMVNENMERIDESLRAIDLSRREKG